MSRVRPFQEEDLAAVGALWGRAFRRPGTPRGVQRYFREVFLDAARGPGPAPSGGDPASLVYEDDAGVIAGFVGALPRRMVFRGRPILALVATQIMVDPGKRRGFAAFELLRTLFAGPQALTFCDGANDRSRSVWERSGGEVARLYSLDWRRVLRPAGYLQQRVARAGSGSPSSLSSSIACVARAAAPLCRAADALAGRLGKLDRAAAIGVPLGRPRAPLATEDLSAAALRALLDQESTTPRPSLHPSHDEGGIAWILDHAARTRAHGPLRKRLCRDAWGEAVGWFIHYAQPGGLSQVLQIGGRPRSIGAVLACLFADAYAAGAVAVSGQADPRWLREITDAHATFTCPSLGVLVQAKDRAILDAIQRGDAALSRLDGEWWLRFAVEPLVD